MAEKIYCDHCSDRILNPADAFYCTDCGKYLCADCQPACGHRCLACKDVLRNRIAAPVDREIYPIFFQVI